MNSPLLPTYKVGDLKIDPGLVLAPMSGVTTSPFRRLMKELNGEAIGLLVTEFISVEALTRKVKRSFEMMQFHPSERPFAIQIFGYDIDRLSEGAAIAEAAGADIVDLNCGCPAPKVVRKGGGCQLMREPEHLAKILKALRKRLTVPLTMKFRSGWDESSRNAVEIAKIAEAEGVAALAVHGRTRVQLYRGLADWEIVRQVSEAVKIPVIGSGDVVDRESALARIETGQVQGLLIGRAALSDPFVFRRIAYGESRELHSEPLLLVTILERYIELLLESFEPRACVGKLKQVVSQMCRGYNWRKDLCRVNTLSEQSAVLHQVRAMIEYGDPAGSVLRAA